MLVNAILVTRKVGNSRHAAQDVGMNRARLIGRVAAVQSAVYQLNRGAGAVDALVGQPAFIRGAELNPVDVYRTIMALVAGIAVAEVVSPGSMTPAAQKRQLRDAIAGLRANARAPDATPLSKSDSARPNALPKLVRARAKGR